MDAHAQSQPTGSLTDAENWLALGAGALLLLGGASRRSKVGACLALASTPLLYRGVTGRWPMERDGDRGDRDIHVRESVRLELPIADVYKFWRLENLPFMSHAEIINEIENQVIAWRSLPGSEVPSAGVVNFETVRGGRTTQVSVHLQYTPPAGKAGALIASLFGRAPSQTIREDLRRFKRLLEAGEAPRTTSDDARSGYASSVL